jgi:predicted amino acid-binding ACT domain protein
MNTQFEHAYVINVMSDDHPGIVAAVGNAVRELGGNIDSASQTVLSGYFTLIMIISLPEELQADELAQRVRQAHPRDSLQVMARPFEPASGCDEDCETFVITAFGPDRQGVLLSFSQYLAGRDINIVDLYADRREGDFMLISQVQIPKHFDISLLQADLEQLGQEMGFAVRLQHENIFVATNQLRLVGNQ